jgi:hypothetical protein
MTITKNFFPKQLFAFQTNTKTMGFIKGALFGMAVYAIVQHITKKDVLTGRSLLDELMERAPDCMETIKDCTKRMKEEFTEPSSSF